MRSLSTLQMNNITKLSPFIDHKHIEYEMCGRELK